MEGDDDYDDDDIPVDDGVFGTDECGPGLIMEGDDDDDDDIPVDDGVYGTDECGPGLIMEGDDDGGGR